MEKMESEAREQRRELLQQQQNIKQKIKAQKVHQNQRKKSKDTKKSSSEETIGLGDVDGDGSGGDDELKIKTDLLLYSTNINNSIKDNKIKKTRKPYKARAHEDIIDGFSIVAFKNYEDLNRAIKLAEDDRLCLLKGAQEGSENKDGTKSENKKSPKKSAKRKEKTNENSMMINTGSNTDKAPSSLKKKKKLKSNGHTSESEVKKKDLFAPQRKDSTFLTDNLHSPRDSKVFDFQETDNSNEPTDDKEVEDKDHGRKSKSNSPKNSSIDDEEKVDDFTLTSHSPINQISTQTEEDKNTQTEKKNTIFASNQENGSKRCLVEDQDDENRSKNKIIKASLLFTPYAIADSQTIETSQDTVTNKHDHDHTSVSSRPIQIQPDTGHKLLPNELKSESITNAGKIKKSNAFGSIASLLESPNPTFNNDHSTTSFTKNHPNINAISQTTNTISSESHPIIIRSHSPIRHSPRGHSPNRERDSYSSNVSSLSRNSITPVNSSSQLPSSLTQQQNLSYSKAANWLSSFPTGLSHPTTSPHKVTSSAGNSTFASSSKPNIAPVAPIQHSHHSVFPRNLLPPNHQMFAPSMLPLSSIGQLSHHSGSQTGSQFGSIFPHGHDPSNEYARKELESRYMAERISTSMSSSLPSFNRPGEAPQIHPHLLNPPLSGPSSNNALFPPPLFKDFSKMDSSFYRTNFPSFPGMMPPPPTPFTSPSQPPNFTPKKTGRWNAMHVRIAWEIYHHQNTSSDNSKDLGKNKEGFPLQQPSTIIKNSNVLTSPVTNIHQNIPVPVSSSSTSADQLKALHHGSSQLNRQNDLYLPFIPQPPLLSHQQQPSPLNRPPSLFDPQMFLNSPQHHLARFPGFLGPTPYGELGPGLLPQDWQRFQQQQKGYNMGSIEEWQNMNYKLSKEYLLKNEKNFKSGLDETNRPSRKDEHKIEKKVHHDSARNSPFRDRSPHRDSRRSFPSPLENGDDSRSSRSHSNDSHSSVQVVHQSSSKSTGRVVKENLLIKGENNQLPPQSQASSLPLLPHDERLQRLINFQPPLSSSHPHHSWDPYASFIPPEPFRLSLMQLSEREREFSARGIVPPLRTPTSYSMNLPLIGIPPPIPIPTSTALQQQHTPLLSVNNSNKEASTIYSRLTPTTSNSTNKSLPISTGQHNKSSHQNGQPPNKMKAQENPLILSTLKDKPE